MGGTDVAKVRFARLARVVVLTAIAATLLVLAAPKASAAPPSNDLIENATVISDVPFSTSLNLAEATASASDPDERCRYRPQQRTVWFQYQASADGAVRATLTSMPGTYSAVIGFEGSPDSLTFLGCDFQALAVRVAAGSTYFFMLATETGTDMTFGLQTAIPPANDLIESATFVDSVPFSATQSTRDATQTPGEPSSCFALEQPTVWFRFDALANQRLRFSLAGVDTSFVSFSGSPGSLTQIGCLQRSQIIATDAGTSYYFMIATEGPQDITFTAQESVPPPNDEIEGATLIDTLPFSATQETSDATANPTDPATACSTAGRATVWFRYQSAHDGALRFVASFGMSVAVFEGTPDSLLPVACGGFGTVNAPVRAGQSYYVMISFPLPALLELTIEALSPPPNDLIENATRIDQLPFFVHQSGQDATKSMTDPATNCVSPERPTVWFRYDAPQDGAIRVIVPQGAAMFVGSPETLTSYQCLTSSFPTPSSNLVPVEGGIAYYLMVATPVTSPLTVDVQEAAPPANDLIQNATAIESLPFGTIQSFVDATSSHADPLAACGIPGGVVTVWYRHQPGQSSTLSVAPGMVVFKGTPADLDLVSCSAPAPQSVAVVSGLSYYFMLVMAPNIGPVPVEIRAADTTPPTLSLPTGISLPATSKTGAVANYSASATDDTDPNPVVACTPPSGTRFPIGDTTVNCTATDAAGNVATGSFVVHIRGAVEQLRALKTIVRNLPAPAPKTTLEKLVIDTIQALEANNKTRACSLLQQFVDRVRVERGVTIAIAKADDMIARATRIRKVVACT